MTKPTARELLDYGEPVWTHAVLAARVEKVLALHKQSSDVDPATGLYWCLYCCDEDGNATWWPCATVRLLNGERP